MAKCYHIITDFHRKVKITIFSFLIYTKRNQKLYNFDSFKNQMIFQSYNRDMTVEQKTKKKSFFLLLNI